MSNRKLLMEMDRTSKETTRALQEYDELNKKLSQSLEGNHPTRSEKLFLDLKRDHLGKVIRLRHQIKVWLDGNDSDHIPHEKKQALGELKTLCEARMEEFDKRERQYKTRGFHKEDGEQDTATISWVKQMCEEMRQQKEVIEGELELQRKDEDLKHRLLAFNYHLFHLELILRGLTNKALDEKEIDELKRDLRDFCDGDLDLDEDSDFYAHLDLNSRLESFIDEVTVFSSANATITSSSTSTAESATALGAPAGGAGKGVAAAAAVAPSKQTASQKKLEEKKRLQEEKDAKAAKAAAAAAAVPPAPAPDTSQQQQLQASKVQVVDKSLAQPAVAASAAPATAAAVAPPLVSAQPTAWQQHAPPPVVVAAAAPPLPPAPVATPPRTAPVRSRLGQQQQTPLYGGTSTSYYTPLSSASSGASSRLPSVVKVSIPPLPPRLLASPFIASPSSLLDTVSDADFLVFLEQARSSNSLSHSHSSSSSSVLTPSLQSFASAVAAAAAAQSSSRSMVSPTPLGSNAFSYTPGKLQPTGQQQQQHLLSPHLLFKQHQQQPASGGDDDAAAGAALSEDEELVLRLDVGEFLRAALPGALSQDQRVQRAVLKCAKQNGARVELGEVELAPFAIQLQREGLDLDVRQRIVKELRERRS